MGKKRQEETGLFAEHFYAVFSPHNNDQEEEVEQDLAKHIQSQEHLKAVTLKEINAKVNILNQKRHQVSILLLPEC